MPKDAKKNIGRFKVQGGELNQYEFEKNQGDVTEQHEAPDAHQTPFEEQEQKQGQGAEAGAGAEQVAASQAGGDAGCTGDEESR